MKTIAVIPALNEYQRLTEVVFQSLGKVDHVVVVDDGSKVPLKNHLIKNDRLTVLRHVINLGKGAALKTGALWAKNHGFDVAVFIDADGQHDPNEIKVVLEPITKSRVDIVFGVRKFNGGMPFIARTGNLILTKALRLLFRISVDDTQSGFRAVRLTAYDKIAWRSPRYAVETEMIVNAGKNKVPYEQVPITTIYHDKYKGTTIVDGLRIMVNMITWRFL